MDKLRTGNYKLLISVSLAQMFTTSKKMLLIKSVNVRSDMYFVLWVLLIVFTEQVRKLKRQRSPSCTLRNSFIMDRYEPNNV
jgi:hypothetical protein